MDYLEKSILDVHSEKASKWSTLERKSTKETEEMQIAGKH